MIAGLFEPCEKIIQADLFEWLLVFSNLNFELVQYEFS